MRWEISSKVISNTGLCSLGEERELKTKGKWFRPVRNELIMTVIFHYRPLGACICACPFTHFDHRVLEYLQARGIAPRPKPRSKPVVDADVEVMTPKIEPIPVASPSMSTKRKRSPEIVELLDSTDDEIELIAVSTTTKRESSPPVKIENQDQKDIDETEVRCCVFEGGDSGLFSFSCRLPFKSHNSRSVSFTRR